MSSDRLDRNGLLFLQFTVQKILLSLLQFVGTAVESVTLVLHQAVKGLLKQMFYREILRLPFLLLIRNLAQNQQSQLTG